MDRNGTTAMYVSGVSDVSEARVSDGALWLAGVETAWVVGFRLCSEVVFSDASKIDGRWL
jgi:hypothetical protein